MDFKLCGEIISEARKEKGYTQKEVAQLLNVSDKAVSKWETGTGCPDVRILSNLTEVLGIDPKVLLSGIAACNETDNGNMKKSRLYVCPYCQNIITSSGSAEVSCCGKLLKELSPQNEDEEHMISCEPSEDDYYVRINHSMTKQHYISFISYITCNRIQTYKLYPEQECEVRFKRYGHGLIYAYCTEDGLIRKII